MKASESSWTDDIQVEERRLQEYLFRKEQSLQLKGASEALKHTLQPIPTSASEDGQVHFGDSLMICCEVTGGLLQADIEDKVSVTDGSRADLEGATLSSGTMMAACPRNVFTISRAKDDDGFRDSVDVHFGQAVRLGASHILSDRPHYLFSSRNSSEGLGQDEMLACLYGRAAAGTLWRLVPPGSRQGAGPPSPIRRNQAFALESIETSHRLRSDKSVRMNSYGNEWRVFCAAAGAEAAPETWMFVDSQWTDQVVEASRKDAHPAAPDAGELMVNPSARADHELHVLETDEATSDYAVLARIFPLLRRSGMHVARQARKMCGRADVSDNGILPIHTFEGVLSWVGVRMQDGEVMKLMNLFEAEPEGSDLISYKRFFATMGANMPEMRIGAVRDAYEKLSRLANAGHVEVTDIQRHWSARCHPEVQRGTMSESDARVDFFNQWEVTAADGTVTWEEFLAYYRDLSMAVEKDDLFVEIVRSAWGLHEAAEPASFE